MFDEYLEAASLEERERNHQIVHFTEILKSSSKGDHAEADNMNL